MKGFPKMLHRLALYAVGILLLIIGNVRFKIYVTGLGAPPQTPNMMTTNNHQRTGDIILIAAEFLRSWRKWEFIDRLSWAGRDDMFIKGYFSAHYEKLSPLIRWFFFHFNFGPALRYINAHPIRPVQLRHLRHLLMDALQGVGNIPVEELLNPGWEQKYPYLHKLSLDYKRKGKTLDLANCYKFCIWRDLNSKASYDIVAEKYRDAVIMTNINIIKDSLSQFADIIKDNHLLYFSVEGELSADGSFSAFRAGLARIIDRCKTMKMIPLNVTYDYMQKPRHAVFLNYGAPIELNNKLQIHELKSIIQKRMIGLHTGTMTSLLSLAIFKFLKTGGSLIKHDILTEAVNEVFSIYRAGRFFYDKRLESARFFANRLKKALKWGARKDLWKLIRTKSSAFNTVLNIEKLNEIRPGPWPFVNFLTYAVNQIPDGIVKQYMAA